MKAEMKEFLKEEIQEVNKSRTSVLIGIAMLILDIVLVICSVINIYSLILALPLVLIIRRQMLEFRENKMVLLLMECIFDEDKKNSNK